MVRVIPVFGRFRHGISHGGGENTAAGLTKKNARSMWLRASFWTEVRT